jgi:hypothetical protein
MGRIVLPLLGWIVQLDVCVSFISHGVLLFFHLS